MAWYKYPEFLNRYAGDSKAYDLTPDPSSNTPSSGIYRCTGCGHEIVSERNKPFPPDKHHLHNNGAPIRWQLVAYADHDPNG